MKVSENWKKNIEKTLKFLEKIEMLNDNLLESQNEHSQFHTGKKAIEKNNSGKQSEILKF